jgi:hypothetical protein
MAPLDKSGTIAHGYEIRVRPVHRAPTGFSINNTSERTTAAVHFGCAQAMPVTIST